jgi:hypothetical protein
VIVRSVRRTPGLLLRIGGIQLIGFLPQIASVYLLFAVVEGTTKRCNGERDKKSVGERSSWGRAWASNRQTEISTARGWVKSRRLDALKMDVGNTNSLSI